MRYRESQTVSESGVERERGGRGLGRGGRGGGRGECGGRRRRLRARTAESLPIREEGPASTVPVDVSAAQDRAEELAELKQQAQRALEALEQLRGRIEQLEHTLPT